MNKCISCGEPLDYPSGDGCAAMTKHKENVMDYKTGQIYGWNGGECPVHPKTKIKIWTRNGNTSDEGGCGAEHYLWRHRQEGGDIIAFQVITPYAEPKVIWVNEFVGGEVEAFSSEADAKKWECSRHTRVAVKYVEAKE